MGREKGKGDREEGRGVMGRREGCCVMYSEGGGEGKPLYLFFMARSMGSN